jgi:hypothetical protein
MASLSSLSSHPNYHQELLHPCIHTANDQCLWLPPLQMRSHDDWRDRPLASSSSPALLHPTLARSIASYRRILLLYSARHLLGRDREGARKAGTTNICTPQRCSNNTQEVITTPPKTLEIPSKQGQQIQGPKTKIPLSQEARTPPWASKQTPSMRNYDSIFAIAVATASPSHLQASPVRPKHPYPAVTNLSRILAPVTPYHLLPQLCITRF